MPVAVVTGANGFVGGAVCRVLIEAGWVVRAMVRDGRCAPAGCTAISWADFQDRTALERACEKADALVHAAGVAHVFHATRDQRDRMICASRDAAAIAAAVARRQCVSMFVLVSSIAAVAGRDAYALGKREVESRVMTMLGESQIRAIILRPPMIYGEGMRGRPLRLFEMVARGIVIPLGGVANLRSVAYIGNVTDAVLQVCTDPEHAPRVVYPADSAPLSTEALVRKMAGALGVHPRLLRIPSWVLTTAGAIGTLSRGVLSPVSREDVLRATGTLLVTSMPEFTEYCIPPFTTDAGLACTANWFRSRQ